MPKSTFNNLSDERKEKILTVCKKEFENNLFEKASVASIVKTLGIARGTFYKYFEDLDDCYFYLLEKETSKIHDLFFKVYNENNDDIVLALREYGQVIANEIHDTSKYSLYRSRYLSWNLIMENKWNDYIKKTVPKSSHNISSTFNPYKMPDGFTNEVVHYIKSIIHDLIQRNFQNNWSKKEFLDRYEKHCNYIVFGIKDRV